MNVVYYNLKQRFLGKFNQKNIPIILYYLVISVGILINLSYALLTPNFFHPDEIYQTLEVAHRYVYGSGFLSWEWKVNYFFVPNDPVRYGELRSLFTPLIFIILFLIGNFLHLNYWNGILPFIRIVMTINFLIGLYFASKILQELNPDKSLPVDKFFLIIALFYHDIIFYASKTLTNTIVASFVFIALYIWLKDNNLSTKNITNENVISNVTKYQKYPKSINKIEYFGGFLVGLAIWIRPDSAVIMGVLVLLNIRKINYAKAINFANGFLLSAVLDGILDLMYYGKFFITFINFLKFNLKYQDMFGSEPFGWYFNTIVTNQNSLLYLYYVSLLVFFLIIIYFLYINLKEQPYNAVFAKETVCFLKLFFWNFFVLYWWESQPHKEGRFVILWEISFLLLGAYSILILAKYLRILIEQKVLNNSKLHIMQKIHLIHKKNSFFLTLILIICLTYPFVITNASEYDHIAWNNFRDLLEASVWVGQQKNVTGVAIDEPIWNNGGYTYLHRNVPIYNFDYPFDTSTLNPRTNIKFPLSTTFLPKALADQHLINYLIVPIYKFYLYNTTNYNFKASVYSSGFRLVHVISNSIDIFII